MGAREVPGGILDGVGSGGHDLEVSGMTEEEELDIEERHAGGGGGVRGDKAGYCGWGKVAPNIKGT